jgi:hypothetical protein
LTLKTARFNDFVHHYCPHITSVPVVPAGIAYEACLPYYKPAEPWLGELWITIVEKIENAISFMKMRPATPFGETADGIPLTAEQTTRLKKRVTTIVLSTISGTGTGGIVGSMVGPFGSAVGAVVGGVVGLASGIWLDKALVNPTPDKEKKDV